MSHFPSLDSYLDPDRFPDESEPECEVCERALAVLRDPFSGEYRCQCCDEDIQQARAEGKGARDIAIYEGSSTPTNDTERLDVQTRRHR